MGRAIVRRPQAFLMDEPLSNLDAKLRVQMRTEIARLQQDLGVTTLYVTHDQVEAMTLGDRVAVMKKGVLQQVAPPQELYDRPVNLFVGGFIGSPAMNMFGGRLASGENGDLRVLLGEQELALTPEFVDSYPTLRGYVDQKVVVGIRPEDMADAALLDPEDIPPGSTLNSVAELVEAMGSDVMVHFTIEAEPVLTEDMVELARDTDKGVNVTEKASSGHTVATARFDPRTSVNAGDSLTTRVDTDKLHFFDPETGLSLRGGDVVVPSRERAS
jgi:multiple sugar transport system ATP-binding protein